MQQQAGESCLTVAEYTAVREVIDAEDLWWEDGQPPSRMSPVLIRRSWTIETAENIAPFVAVAAQTAERKRLFVRGGAPLSIQASAMAHTLAHDILGHLYDVDIIATNLVRSRFINRGVHPAHDRAAAIAMTLLLIPDRFAHSDLPVSEIASRCGVPTGIVMRRLTGTVLREDDPPTIIRIDRRGPARTWSREAASRNTGTDRLY